MDGNIYSGFGRGLQSLGAEMFRKVETPQEKREREMREKLLNAQVRETDAQAAAREATAELAPQQRADLSALGMDIFKSRDYQPSGIGQQSAAADIPAPDEGQAIPMTQPGLTADLGRITLGARDEDERMAALSQRKGTDILSTRPDLLGTEGGKQLLDLYQEQEKTTTADNWKQKEDYRFNHELQLKALEREAKLDEAESKAKDNKAQFEFQLGKEFSNDQTVKEYTTLKNSIGRMNVVWNDKVKKDNPRVKGIIDQTLITMFNKFIDPTGTVREAEYDRTPEGAAITARIPGYLEKLTTGGPGITDELRNEMVSEANKMYSAIEGNMKSVVDDYRDRAEKWEINFDNVVGKRHKILLGESSTVGKSKYEIVEVK